MEIQKFVASLLQNGGASFNLVTKDLNPKTGYLVSTLSNELKMPLEALNIGLVLDYIHNKKLLLNESDFYLGGWINDDLVYLDVSQRYQDKRNALKKGIQNKQIAIFDCYKQEVIYLPEVQKTGTETQKQSFITQWIDKNVL
jgi:hypothetical protein